MDVVAMELHYTCNFAQPIQIQKLMSWWTEKPERSGKKLTSFAQSYHEQSKEHGRC
jgi:hypothetical protein